jgi:hypothetical protein
MRTFAHHEHELRLVIERRGAGGPSHLGVLAAHRVDELDEAGRLVRHLGQHLVREQLFAVLARVLADAEEFGRVWNRWEKLEAIDRLHESRAFSDARQLLGTRRSSLRAAAGTSTTPLPRTMPSRAPARPGPPIVASFTSPLPLFACFPRSASPRSTFSGRH